MLQLRKVIMDIWFNKTRTVLIVLTIAIGIFIVGTISRAWQILSREMAQGFAATSPHNGVVLTADFFDEDIVNAIRRMPEVQEAEGRATAHMLVYVGPDTWRSLDLVTVPDFDHIRLDKIAFVDGVLPPPSQAVLLERSSLTLLEQVVAYPQEGVSTDNIDQSILVELRNGKQSTLKVAGLVHDLSLFPSSFSKIGYGYITPKTQQRLTGRQGFDELRFTVAEHNDDKAHIQQVIDRITNKLEAAGVTVRGQEIVGIGQHPLDNILQAVLFLLAALSLFALLLSGFQVINTISALMARQVRQIGIMKSIGATGSNILTIYVGVVLCFSLLAMLVAIPLATMGSRQLALFMADLLNFNITSLAISPVGYLPEIFAGLMMPLLVAFIPVLRGARLTVREAVSSVGAQALTFGTTRLDQWLNRIRGLPSSVLYTIRNAFRNKVRLALTLVALTIAGTVFIAVVGVRSSLLITLEAVAAYRKQDIEMRFAKYQRIPELERIALEMPGVTRTESRIGIFATRLYPDGREGNGDFFISGVSATTPFLQPTLIRGRWLLPDEKHAVVVNMEFLDAEPDIEVGDEITLKIAGRTDKWQIVGVVMGQVIGGGVMAPLAYTRYQDLAVATSRVGQADRILIETDSQTNPAETLKALRDHFNALGIQVSAAELNSEVRETLQIPFNILLSLIFLMILLFAIAGGLGLMGLMSLNVLERTQEIGVIRATGATTAIVTQIIMTEGVFIGLLSWFLAMLLAIPVSKLMSDTVGFLFLRVPLSYTFPFNGIVLWLVVIIALSVLASFLPTRSATQLKVAEILSYE